MARVRSTKGFMKGISEDVAMQRAPAMAMVMIKVSKGAGEDVAKRISMFDAVEDIYFITGDADILAKVRFSSLQEIKQFLMKDLSGIEGIESTKTLSIIGAYKESGLIL